MSFVDDNVPPSAPAGEQIERGIRDVLLEILRASGAMQSDPWYLLRIHQGWPDFWAAIADIEARLGAEWGQHMRYLEWQGSRDTSASSSETYLFALPPAFFIGALELCLTATLPPARLSAVESMNALTARRGLAYVFDQDGTASWRGDPATHRLVVAPALGALADQRLAGARSEFDAALTHLTLATDKDFEGGIDEAAKSIESAMKVLCAAHSVKLNGHEVAADLYTKLNSAGVLSPPARFAVLAAAQLRNDQAAHGAGAVPRTGQAAEARMAVRAAASALTYLASKLPS